MNFISKKYQNWSIFYKILFFFAIIIALLFSLTLFNFFTYYRQTETRSITALQAAANQSSNEINTYLSDIAALTQIPLAKKVDDIDVAYALNHLEKGTASQMEISALHKLLNDILDYKKDVHSVFLFTPAGKVVYDFQFIALTNDFKIQNTIWFQDLMNSSGKAQSLPPFSLRYYEDLVSKNDYMFSTGRAIRMVSSNQLTGAIIINTSIQYLKNIVSNMLSYQNQRIIIADADGTVIYDTDEVNIGQAIDASLFSLFSEQTFPEHFTLNNTRCLLGHATVQNSGWHLLNIVPLHSLNHQLYSTAAKTGFSIVGICFLAIVITSVISHHIVGPLQELVEQMKSVNYENFDVALKDDRKDEIGQLKMAFFNMISKIKQLIKEKYSDELEKKELEISMLQMQISPHFLYNTLESMSMMAEINDDFETANMTIALGRIMRYSLGSQSEFVLLSEEIYCLNEYIQLQKERLTNVAFDEHIDYTLYEQKTVRLLLQPIVENAVYHGMDQMRSGGLISITGHRDNNHIILNVSDNGKGMALSDVQMLNDYINDRNSAFKSIGLKNVNKRIKLYFGQSYGLHIDSKPGQGTSITITLPFIEK